MQSFLSLQDSLCCDARLARRLRFACEDGARRPSECAVVHQVRPQEAHEEAAKEEALEGNHFSLTRQHGCVDP